MGLAEYLLDLYVGLDNLAYRTEQGLHKWQDG